MLSRFEIPELVYSSCIHGPVTIFPMIPSARNCNKMLMFLKSFTSDVRKVALLLQLFNISLALFLDNTKHRQDETVRENDYQHIEL